MRHWPTRRPYRKRYIVVKLTKGIDRLTLTKELNRVGRRGMCLDEKERPWLFLIDIVSDYAIVRAPHRCLGLARDIIANCPHISFTVRTTGTVKGARRIIEGRIRAAYERKKS